MRIAMAVLADAANVREGMLNVLSAGVTQVGRVSYPAPLGSTLALMIEVRPDDIADDLLVSVEIDRQSGDGDDAPVAKIEAQLVVEPARTATFYAAVPIPLAAVEIPSVGDYVLTISVGSMAPFAIEFSAFEAHPQQ